MNAYYARFDTAHMAALEAAYVAARREIDRVHAAERAAAYGSAERALLRQARHAAEDAAIRLGDDIAAERAAPWRRGDRTVRVHVGGDK